MTRKKIFIYGMNSKYLIFPVFTYLLKNGYKVIFINNIINNNLKKDIILTSSSSKQYEIFSEFYTYNVYEMLDNKILFYEFIKNEINNSHIKMIPTYDKKYIGPNKYSEFIIKKSNSSASSGNRIIKDNIYNLINKYSNTHQIQDILNIKYIYSVDYVCFDGKIFGTFVWQTSNKFPKMIDYLILFRDYMLKKKTSIISNYIDNINIKEFTENIVKKLNLNGLINFEFLVDDNDTIYIMESNPRLSGCVYIKEYLDCIIKPYITKKKDKNKKFKKFNYFNFI